MSPPDGFLAQAVPCQDALYRLALRMTGQPASAEDLVQEAWLKAFRNYHRFRKGTNFKAWIFKILTNVHFSEYRRRARKPAPTDLAELDPGGGAAASYLSSQDVQALKEKIGDTAKQVLDGMPVDFLMVFLLATIEDMKYREISSILGIPLGTVMSRLSRARKYLRKALLEYLPDDSSPAAGIR